MKRLILLLILSSCGRQQTEKLDNAALADKDTNLYALLDQLPTLKTPLTFNSDGQITGGDFTLNEELTNKISEIVPGLSLLGKIYRTENFIAIISIAPADIATPVLTTYDRNGKEIDSFFMYPTAGGDISYYSKNIITLNENKELILTDSTLTRKINEEGSDEIPGTDSLSVTKKKFHVTDKGVIEEIG